MASEREDAKQAISTRDQVDPELDNAFLAAQKLQIDLQRENNRHAMDMRNADLGWFGKIAGGSNSAAFVAAIVSLISVIAGGVLWWLGQPDAGKAFLGLAGTAIGFLFGRTGK